MMAFPYRQRQRSCTVLSLLIVTAAACEAGQPHDGDFGWQAQSPVVEEADGSAPNGEPAPAPTPPKAFQAARKEALLQSTGGSVRLPIFAAPPAIKRSRAEVKYQEWSWDCACWRTKEAMIDVPPPVAPWDVGDLVVGYVSLPDGVETLAALERHVNAASIEEAISEYRDIVADVGRATEELRAIMASHVITNPEQYVRAVADLVGWMAKYWKLLSNSSTLDPILAAANAAQSVFYDLAGQVEFVVEKGADSLESDLEHELEHRIKAVVMQGPAPLGTVWGSRADVDLEVVVPDAKLLNGIHRTILSKMKEFDTTIANLNQLFRAMTSPSAQIMQYLSSIHIPQNNDLHRGELTLEGSARTAWNAYGDGFALTRSIVYLREYPEYFAKVDEDGKYAFKGLRAGMTVTPTIIPVSYVPNMIEFLQNPPDGCPNDSSCPWYAPILQFAFTDATGYLSTAGATHTMSDHHVRSADFEVPSFLIYFVFKQVLALDEAGFHYDHRGIVQATLRCDGAQDKVVGSTVKLIASDGRELTPYYYGYPEELPNSASDFAKLLKQLMGGSNIPIPIPTRGLASKDGGVVFLNVPPGQYRLQATSATGTLVFSQPTVRVEAGTFTNASPPQSIHCVADKDDDRHGYAEIQGEGVLAYFDFGEPDHVAARNIEEDTDEQTFALYDTGSASADSKDDADRNTLHDLSPNHHAGTMWGGQRHKDSVMGKTIRLDENDYATTDVPIDRGGEGITLMAWVKPELPGEAGRRYHLLTTGTDAQDWSLFIQDGTWRINTGALEWNTGIKVAAADCKVGQWQRVEVRLSRQGASFYKNLGLPDEAKAFTDSVGFGSATRRLAIGRVREAAGVEGGQDVSFVGTVDAVLVFAGSLPDGPPDDRPPTITRFEKQGQGRNLANGTIELRFDLEAVDDVGVSAWLITHQKDGLSVTPPSACEQGDKSWQSEKPTSYSFEYSEGTFNVYAWAKDAWGNVSPDAKYLTVVARPEHVTIVKHLQVAGVTPCTIGEVLGTSTASIGAMRLTLVGGGGGGGGGASRKSGSDRAGGGGGGGAGESISVVIDDELHLSRIDAGTKVELVVGGGGSGGKGGDKGNSGRNGAAGESTFVRLVYQDGTSDTFVARGGQGGERGGNDNGKDGGDGGLGGDGDATSSLKGQSNGKDGQAGRGGDNGRGHGDAAAKGKVGDGAPAGSGGGGGGGSGVESRYKGHRGGDGGSGTIMLTLDATV